MNYFLAEILGMAGEDRRPSAILNLNPFIEVTDTTLTPNSTQSVHTDRTPSPTEDMPWKTTGKGHKSRAISETQYADTEVEELLTMLRETESLEEQGDILQYLVSLLFNELFSFCLFPFLEIYNFIRIIGRFTRALFQYGHGRRRSSSISKRLIKGPL